MIQNVTRVTTKNPAEKLARKRLTVLQLAEQLGNVSEACRRGGLDRTSFYEWKRRFQTHGLNGLKDMPPIARDHPLTTPREVVEKLIDLALSNPMWGCVRLSDELRLRGMTLSSRTIQKRLVINADGGSAMTAKSTLQLFTDLGVIKSRSRPHVSNDYPYSEAQFKTLKYSSSFPTYFANIEQAREYMRDFIAWYNNDDHHAGLALVTPFDVHFGRAEQRLADRNATLADAAAPSAGARAPRR